MGTLGLGLSMPAVTCFQQKGNIYIPLLNNQQTVQLPDQLADSKGTNWKTFSPLKQTEEIQEQYLE